MKPQGSPLEVEASGPSDQCRMEVCTACGIGEMPITYPRHFLLPEYMSNLARNIVEQGKGVGGRKSFGKA